MHSTCHEHEVMPVAICLFSLYFDATGSLLIELQENLHNYTFCKLHLTAANWRIERNLRSNGTTYVTVS